jgi:hypothetical protein
MQAPGLSLRSRRNLFMRPRTVRHGLRQQIAIVKAIGDDLFELIEVVQIGCHCGRF